MGYAVEWSDQYTSELDGKQFCPEAIEMLGGSFSPDIVTQAWEYTDQIQNDILKNKLIFILTILFSIINMLAKQLKSVLSGEFCKERYRQLQEENEERAATNDVLRASNTKLENDNKELKKQISLLVQKGMALTEGFMHVSEIALAHTSARFDSNRERSNRIEGIDDGDLLNDIEGTDEESKDWINGYTEFFFTEDDVFGSASTKSEDTNSKKKGTRKKQKKEKKQEQEEPSEKDRSRRSKPPEGVEAPVKQAEEELEQQTESPTEQKEPRNYRTRNMGDQTEVIKNIQFHEYELGIPLVSSGEVKIFTQNVPFTNEDAARLLREVNPGVEVDKAKVTVLAGQYRLESVEYFKAVHACKLEYKVSVAYDDECPETHDGEADGAINTDPVRTHSVEDGVDSLAEEILNAFGEEQNASEDIPQGGMERFAENGQNAASETPDDVDKDAEYPASANEEQHENSQEASKEEKKSSKRKSGKGGGGGGKRKENKKKNRRKSKSRKRNLQKKRRTIRGKTYSSKPYRQNSHLSPSLLAKLLYIHFTLLVPVFRMVSMLWQKGVCVSQGTVYNWINIAAEDLLPLATFMFTELKSYGYIHADETPGLVFREKGRENGTKSYFWFYVSAVCAPHPICYVKYHPGRSGDFPAKDLEGWKGKLITDAYQAYNSVIGIIRCMCMSHARRYFFIAARFGCTLSRRAKAKQIVNLFDQLFANERAYKEAGLTYEEILVKRKTEGQRLFDEISRLSQDIVESDKYKSSALFRAAGYFCNNKEGLSQFLADGKVPLSNNLAERMIKPFALFRANCLFSGSPDGADHTATCFTIVRTAELNGLDAQSYLDYVFIRIMETPKEQRSNPEFLRQLLPWEKGPQANCGKIIRGKTSEYETFRKVA